MTHQGPQKWFSMFDVPYHPIQLPFLSGRLGVMGAPHWPIGSITQNVYIKRRLFVPKWHMRAPRYSLWCLMCFTCPMLLSNAAIPQWLVGSNVVFLTGRLGVSHIMHISRDDYLCPSDTSGPTDMVFNVWCVSRAPYCYRMQPFLSGRLGVMWRSSLAGWEYQT